MPISADTPSTLASTPAGPGLVTARARTRFALAGAFLFAVTAIVGCGDGAKSFGSKATPSAAEVAQTICSKAYGCCTAAQLMGNDLAGTSEAECETKTAASYENQIATISASEGKGRAVYEPQLLMACLAAIRASTCADLGTTNHVSGVPGCGSFATPKVVVGAACGFDWECAGGWCEHAPMTSGDGICRAFVGEGQDCSVDKCGPAAACTGTPKTCLVQRATGAVCTSANMCGSGICDSASGTCAPPAGGSCFFGSGCQIGGGAPGRGAVVTVAALALLLVGGRRGARRRPRR